MTALPARTSVSDTYPNPSNAVARIGNGQVWDVLNEFAEKPELDLASATTCDIGGQLSTKLRITGATTITSLGTNYRGPIHLRMAGALTITHNSTTLICPGATSITTKAEDAFIAWPKATSGTADGWLIVKVSFAAASQSSQGVVELATDTEAQAGTDATRCVTPDNLGAVVLGLGQTWQNVAASRALNTNYTNATGRPIVVSVAAMLSLANSTLWVNVGGSPVGFSSGNYVASGWSAAQPVIVPPGATYSATINGSASASSLSWLELR